jgi:hypothetical protein
MADAIRGKSRLTAALHPLSLHFGQPLAPSHLRPHVAKVPQQRKIRQTTLFPVENYLKQAFEFRSAV